MPFRSFFGRLYGQLPGSVCERFPGFPDRKVMMTAFSLFMLTSLAGCEISPEDIKFREPPENYSEKPVACQEDGCSESN